MTNSLKHIISQQYAFINLGDVLVTLTVLPREMCDWFIVNKYWKEVVKIKSLHKHIHFPYAIQCGITQFFISVPPPQLVRANM